MGVEELGVSFHANSMFYQAHLSGHLEAVDIQMSEAYKPLF